MYEETEILTVEALNMLLDFAEKRSSSNKKNTSESCEIAIYKFTEAEGMSF